MYHRGYCVRVAGGNARAGAKLEIATSGCHKFAFTKKGSLMHNSTHLCIQTSNKVGRNSFYHRSLSPPTADSALTRESVFQRSRSLPITFNSTQRGLVETKFRCYRTTVSLVFLRFFSLQQCLPVKFLIGPLQSF